MDKTKIANKIVKAIIDDLCDRSGLQNEWEATDKDIRKEIEETWMQLVLDELEKDLDE